MSFTLSAAGQKTKWLELHSLASEVSFTVTGFTGEIELQYSNAEAYDKGADYVVDDTVIAAPVLRQIPFGVAKYCRFVLNTLTTGGPVVIGFAKAKDARGHLVDVGEQPLPRVEPYS